MQKYSFFSYVTLLIWVFSVSWAGAEKKKDEPKGLHTGKGSAKSSAPVKATHTGKISRDGRLDICIDRSEAKAIACLYQLGYLGERTEVDENFDGTGGKEDESPVGFGKGLLKNPGARIQTPAMGAMRGASRFGPTGHQGSAGASSTPIGVGGVSHEHREGVGPHSGGKDKAPPPNPSGVVR